MILITGATGQLGRLVIDALLKRTDASQIVAAVRNLDNAKDLAEKGIQLRLADYDQPETLNTAFKGITKLLLISSSDMQNRQSQHHNVITAAKLAGIPFIAYTSLLNADSSPLALAADHIATEKLLAESGIPHALLRNGWYTENYTMNIPMALTHGVICGSSADGKYSTAPRLDYAEAAAVVLTSDKQAGKVYELAGDKAFTLSEYAAAVSKAAGQVIAYKDMPEAEFAQLLLGAGLPEGFATLLANSEVGAAKGGLYSESRDLSRLIGRPTIALEDTIKATLEGI
ncbi:SDR family oxidoreductase [Agarivorans sp. QJM3NY_33]|uniref:SDR family oxidoreductase n=1 Tax=Agarivorans sp. QJM3NY_33 TaxID=3421432 RepID=UPI003D7C89A4